MEDEMMPLPSEEATPPVTKMYFVSPTILCFLYLIYSLYFTIWQETSDASCLKKRKNTKKEGERKYFVPTFSLKFRIPVVSQSYLLRFSFGPPSFLLRFYRSEHGAKGNRSKALAKALSRREKDNALSRERHQPGNWHNFCCFFRQSNVACKPNDVT